MVTETFSITEVLDRLWRQPAKRAELAEAAAKDLPFQELQVLAAWDAAATSSFTPGDLTLTESGFGVLNDHGELVFRALLLKKSEASVLPLISYSDVPFHVGLRDGVFRPQEPQEHEMASLIVALQLIRDHLDSVLFCSEPKRSQGIESLAEIANIESGRFRKLSIWYTRLLLS